MSGHLSGCLSAQRAHLCPFRSECGSVVPTTAPVLDDLAETL